MTAIGFLNGHHNVCPVSIHRLQFGVCQNRKIGRVDERVVATIYLHGTVDLTEENNSNYEEDP